MSSKPLPDGPSGADGGGGGDAPAAAPGTLRWVRSLSSLEAFGVADGPGGLVVTGTITVPADLGGGPLTPAGGPAMLVAGFNSDTAAHLFSVQHGGAGSVFPFLHTLDSNGAPLINGVSYGDVDLGKGQVAGGTPGTPVNIPADGYIGLYGPSAPLWVSRIVGPGEDKIVATAPGPGSTVYGAGWFEQSPTFNGGTLTSAGGRDLFLARFNTFTGAVELTRTYGGTLRDELSSAARSGSAVVVAGMFDDTLAFTGAPAITSGGMLDVWIAKLDAAGNGIWAVRYGGAGDDRDPRIATDAAGDIYITGSFTDQARFGTFPLVAHGTGDVDIFVAKLHATDGSVAWAVSLGAPPPTMSPFTDGPLDIAVDAAGHVAVAGSLAGALDGKPSAGGVDALIATFDAATGAAGWRTVVSTMGDDRTFALTYGRNGDLYAVVDLGGAYDFGMPVIGAPSPAAALLRFAP